MCHFSPCLCPKNRDRYNVFSAVLCNPGTRKAYNTHVEIHSATVQRLNGVVDAFNQAVAAYNARNFCRTVKGGVDLEVREKVEVKRLNVEEHEMLKHFRVLAEEVHADESQKKPHAYVPTVVEDIEDQEDVHLNIWRLTSPTKPAKMELEQQVVLHSLKQADPWTWHVVL